MATTLERHSRLHDVSTLHNRIKDRRESPEVDRLRLSTGNFVGKHFLAIVF